MLYVYINYIALAIDPFWALAIDPFLAWAGPGPAPAPYVRRPLGRPQGGRGGLRGSSAWGRPGPAHAKKGSIATAQEGINSKGNVIDTYHVQYMFL